MKFYYVIESTTEQFFSNLEKNVKKFNAHNYYPITLKRYPKYFIIKNDSILTRGLNLYFKAVITEETPFLKICGYLRMSLTGRIITVFASAIIIYKTLQMGFEVAFLYFLLIHVALFCKYFYDKHVFKTFLIEFLEKYSKTKI